MRLNRSHPTAFYYIQPSYTTNNPNNYGRKITLLRRGTSGIQEHYKRKTSLGTSRLQFDDAAADGNGVEDTSPTYKALEEGSTSQSKEEIAQMANRQQKFIQGLEAALVRIENKTYGIDRITGQLIPKERLRIVPHATLSVESKNARKK